MRTPRLTLPVGLRLLPGYRLGDVPGDVIAGILVAALAVPQALGYAAVAGVPVQVGLYTLPPALLAYALFGSSRLLFVGPVSTVSVLSGTIVRRLADGDPARAVELTAALAVIAGLVLIVAGLLQIGWVAQFLSEPIVTGFVAGLVVLIVLGEIPGLAGLPVPSGSVFERIYQIAQDVTSVDALTLTVGAAALVVLFVGSRVLPRVPWSLLVVIVAVVASAHLNLAERGVRVVGQIPSGLPIPSLPLFDVSLWGDLIAGGVAIAAVGIAEGLAAARTFAGSRPTEIVKDDTELIATGMADLASGVFGGMGVGGSLSKTAANARAGARTQMSGVAAAVVVVTFVAFAAGLLTDLPRTVLSAIVIHAVWGLVQPSAFRRYAQVRRNDLVAALMAFGGVLALGPLNGLLVAVAQSLLGLVYRSMQVTIDEMGKVSDEKAAWGSLASDPLRKTYEGVIVLRPDSPLFWANAAAVADRVLRAVDERPGRQALVLDLEATNQMDTTTAERLQTLLDALRTRGIDLYLVRVFGNVRAVLEASGFMASMGENHVWHSISAGVKYARTHALASTVDEADEAEDVAEDDEEAIVSRRDRKGSSV